MSIRELIDNQELKLAQQIINQSKIPSPPHTLLSLQSELSRQEPDYQSIIDKVTEDAALTGQVIKMVNSPIYGLNIEVNSLQQAVKLLGLKKLKDFIINPSYRLAM